MGYARFVENVESICSIALAESFMRLVSIQIDDRIIVLVESRGTWH